MHPTARLRRWTPLLTTCAVLLLLILVGVIQYQWFSKSAAGEIDQTVRGLEATVRQTVLREFQRYAPVVTELERLRQAGPAAGADLQADLDKLMRTYGPGAAGGGLVSWVGWATPGAPVYHRCGTAGAWAQAPYPEAPWAAEARNPLAPAGAPKENVLVIRGDRAGGPIVLVGLDIRAFFESYVFASLKEVFPGAELAWTESQEEGPPPGFDRRTYAFNPLTALIGAASLPSPLKVGIPKFIDLGRGDGRGPGAPNFRVFASWEVAVTLPPDTPGLGIESRLAWNWLGGMLLLVVLGAAFGVVLRQTGRLADLRRREREFVASVSHELRTPLTVIRSAADNFSRGIVPAERQGRYGQLILDQSVRLGRMIEEMLAFAQTEAGPGQKVLAPIVFESWFAEVRPALDTLAASRSVTLHWDVAGVPSGGRTDPEVLRLILENLVVNAVNHAYPAETAGPPRPVRITLRYLVPGRLELTVDDDGRGIAAAEARKVFEPFYRDQVSRNNQEKGSGLGLFLAHRQARRLGGDLRLETPWRRPDGVKRPGCRFTAVIPLTTEEGDGR